MSAIGWTAYSRVLGSLTEAVGRTPLVRLRRVAADPEPAILMKLDWYGSIVVLACDTGQRYFSTALCGEAKHVEVPEREHPLDARSQALLDSFQSRWEIIE